MSAVSPIDTQIISLQRVFDLQRATVATLRPLPDPALAPATKVGTPKVSATSRIDMYL